MVRYDKRILNSLLDSYENSRLFTGENKVTVQIAYPFQKKNIPAYFEEGSLAYEDIHGAMKEMEARGFLRIQWKNGRENHIISKVILELEQLEQVYEYLGRPPKLDLQQRNLKLLHQARQQYTTPVCSALAGYLQRRLEENKPVKEYLELADLEKTGRLLEAIAAIEENERPCYLREFSIEHFHDSKALEALRGAITKAMRAFRQDFASKDWWDILAEYGIYHTPNYVYFKGNAALRIEGETLPVSRLRQGIGISGEDIDRVELADLENIKKVLTIENLTTFFSWREENCLIIYLGGYHNRVRRRLLQKIYESLPGAAYFHFGDIDAGGFRIYEDLCSKTGIPFRTYSMDLETLKRYEAYGRPLSERDRKALQELQKAGNASYQEVLGYMLEHNVKLEQECIIKERQ